MRFIDLFAGVGGFHYGIDRAYKSQDDELQITNGKHLSNSDNPQRATATCVYSNEWDKYANSVYRKHYGECDDRDIRTIPGSDIPDHDLLVGGFPCQAFSVAGKRAGFDDTRGTLFFEIARILRDKRPRYLLLENVKGLLSHDSGKTFQTILGVLSDIGYGVQWQVLNSKDFGVPQNRERIYIVGHLRGTARPEVFPIGGTDGEDTQPDKGRSAELFPTIRATHYKSGDNQPLIKQLNQPNHSNDRVYASDGISPTLNTMQGGNRQPFIAAQRGRYNADGKTEQKFEPRYDGISSTLTAVQKDNMVVDPPRIRRLTPIECERLQGFPDNWTEFGADGEKISDTQRYKMMGNAVTTNVVSAIIRRLL
jgi:DNA (cytosine-5)-methyltransferase 1